MKKHLASPIHYSNAYSTPTNSPQRKRQGPFSGKYWCALDISPGKLFLTPEKKPLNQEPYWDDTLYLNLKFNLIEQNKNTVREKLQSSFQFILKNHKIVEKTHLTSSIFKFLITDPVMNESIPKILVELKKDIPDSKSKINLEEKQCLVHILNQIQLLFTRTVSNSYIEKIQNCLNQIECNTHKKEWTNFSQKLTDYLREKISNSVKLISKIQKNTEPSLKLTIEILQNNEESITTKLEHCSTIQKSVNFKNISEEKGVFLDLTHALVSNEIEQIKNTINTAIATYELILDTLSEIATLTPKQKKVESKLIGNLRIVTTSPDSVSASFDFDTLSLQLFEQHHHLSDQNKEWDLNKFHDLNDQLHILSTIQNTFLLLNKKQLPEETNKNIHEIESQIHTFLSHYAPTHNSIFDTVNTVTRNHIDYPPPSPKIFKLKEILINKVFSRLSSNLKFMFGILEIKFPIQMPHIQKDNLPFSIFIISFSGGEKAIESINNTLSKATLDKPELVDFELDSIRLAKKESTYPFLKRVANIKTSSTAARVHDHFAHVCAETPLFVEAEDTLSQPLYENAQYQIKLGVFNYKLNDEYDRSSPHKYGEHQLPCLGCNLNQQTIINQFPKILRQSNTFDPSSILTPEKRKPHLFQPLSPTNRIHPPTQIQHGVAINKIRTKLKRIDLYIKTTTTIPPKTYSKIELYKNELAQDLENTRRALTLLSPSTTKIPINLFEDIATES